MDCHSVFTNEKTPVEGLEECNDVALSFLKQSDSSVGTFILHLKPPTRTTIGAHFQIEDVYRLLGLEKQEECNILKDSGGCWCIELGRKNDDDDRVEINAQKTAKWVAENLQNKVEELLKTMNEIRRNFHQSFPAQ